MARSDPWPRLDTPGWLQTSATLHMWSQIIGKTRLALAPPVNHWWHVALYLSARGLTTSPMPWGTEALEIELDFVSHQLRATLTDGRTEQLPLVSQTVAGFFARYQRMLRAMLGEDVHIWPHPVEVVRAIPFDEDREHKEYDPTWAHAFWKALLRARAVMQRFRGEFLGKASPVHFYWGSFDLALSRFSGRPAPRHPGGAPNCPDDVPREAYSHEVSSAGFWPGNAEFPKATFFSYAYPQPSGFAEAKVLPQAAYYDTTFKEFMLPYEAVRTARDPDGDLRDFLHSTYAAAADLGDWNRRSLERPARSDDRLMEEAQPHA